MTVWQLGGDGVTCRDCGVQSSVSGGHGCCLGASAFVLRSIIKDRKKEKENGREESFNLFSLYKDTYLKRLKKEKWFSYVLLQIGETSIEECKF